MTGAKVFRSASLHSVNLGHDNSCNEMLWLLKCYARFKKQYVFMEKKFSMPVKCNDPTSSSGIACAVHFERLKACSSEVSFAILLLNPLAYLTFVYAKQVSGPYGPVLLHLENTLFRLSIYQNYYNFYSTEINFKCFIEVFIFYYIFLICQFLVVFVQTS